MPAPTAIPDGVLCPGCQYDLTGNESGTCPECGRAMTKLDVARAIELRRFMASGRRTVKRLCYAFVVVGLVLAAFSGLAFRQAIAGLFVLLALSVLVLGTVAVGIVASFAAPRNRRAAFHLTWLQTMIWLHLPWASVPVLAVVASVLGVIASQGADNAASGTGVGWSLGVLMWVGLVIASTLVWIDSWSTRTWMTGGLRSSVAAIAAGLLCQGATVACGLVLGYLTPSVLSRLGF